MTERSPDPDQRATPEDIATLYSRANMQGNKYWDFSASRKEVRGQFRHRKMREQAERVEAGPQAAAPPREDQLPQAEPEATGGEVRAVETGPPGGMRVLTGSRVPATQTPAGRISWAGTESRREETGPGPRTQWLAPREQGAGYGPAARGETLPREGGASAARWFALQSVFAPAEIDRVAPPVAVPTGFEQRPPMVAVFSLAGGVGKTCLVATLGRALSALGERVLLADTATCGLLPFYFGSREFRPGVVRTFSPPSPPAAETDAPVHLLSLEAERYPGDGGEQDRLLGELVRDGCGTSRILVDVATASRDVTSRLLLLQPAVLVPILPDMSSVACLGSLEAFLAGAARPEAGISTLYLLNQFDASSPLHLDVREMLRQQLGDRLLPFVLRRSSAVSEALAEGMTVIDYAPRSAAAEDYWRLADWLRGFAAPATVGYGGVRWSER